MKTTNQQKLIKALTELLNNADNYSANPEVQAFNDKAPKEFQELREFKQWEKSYRNADKLLKELGSPRT
jgi:hypothetical protein